MKTILYYITQTIKYVSITVVFIACLLALGVGLKEILNEESWYPAFFWIAVIVCIFFYGKEIQDKKDVQNKEGKRWNDIENGINQHHDKHYAEEREQIKIGLKEYIKKETEKSIENQLFNTCKDLVIGEGYASPALLQRKLKTPYEIASSLMNLLEEKNIIDPADGAKPRRIKPEYTKAPFPFNFD